MRIIDRQHTGAYVAYVTPQVSQPVSQSVAYTWTQLELNVFKITSRQFVGIVARM